MITDFPWHITAKHIRKARLNCMINSVNQDLLVGGIVEKKYSVSKPYMQSF